MNHNMTAGTKCLERNNIIIVINKTMSHKQRIMNYRMAKNKLLNTV